MSGPPALALPGRDDAGAGMGAGGVGGSDVAIGPVSRFFGQAGNAYKVVYVVDVSASLMICGFLNQGGVASCRVYIGTSFFPF